MEDIQHMKQTILGVLEDPSMDSSAIRTTLEQLYGQLTLFQDRCIVTVKPRTFEEEVAQWDAIHAKELDQMMRSFKIWKKTENICKSKEHAQMMIAFLQRTKTEGIEVKMIRSDYHYRVFFTKEPIEEKGLYWHTMYMWKDEGSRLPEGFLKGHVQQTYNCMIHELDE